MDRLARAMLGVVTLLSSLLLIVGGFVCYWQVWDAIRVVSAGGPPQHPMFVMLYFLVCPASSLILLAFYLFHAWRISPMPAERKRYWLTVLLIFNIFAMPVYWYRVVWKRGG